ncbi:hypothetical protein CL622_07535 [archaeon]|nr:hypothetical protein [archaeon]|tara:strand:+ start:386 stop:610 length:225 start_codon:yes stop_codon:yes gene_type:complete
MSELPPMHDEAVKQAQWLWDVCYKHAVHSVGITDWSTASFEDKKRVDIFQSVLFKAMNDNVNQIRLAQAIKGKV